MDYQTNYQTPATQQQANQPQQSARVPVTAIFGLLSGILSILICLAGWYFTSIVIVLAGVALGVIGVVLGAIGMEKAGKADCGMGIAVAGFACGMIGAVAALALLPFVGVLRKVNEVTDFGTTVVDAITGLFS